MGFVAALGAPRTGDLLHRVIGHYDHITAEMRLGRAGTSGRVRRQTRIVGGRGRLLARHRLRRAATGRGLTNALDHDSAIMEAADMTRTGADR